MKKGRDRNGPDRREFLAGASFLAAVTGIGLGVSARRALAQPVLETGDIRVSTISDG